MLDPSGNDELKTILWRQHLDFKESVRLVQGEIASGVGIEKDSSGPSPMDWGRSNQAILRAAGRWSRRSPWCLAGIRLN